MTALLCVVCFGGGVALGMYLVDRARARRARRFEQSLREQFRMKMSNGRRA